MKGDNRRKPKVDELEQFLQGFISSTEEKFPEHANATLPHALAKMCRLMYKRLPKEGLMAKSVQGIWKDFQVAYNRAMVTHQQRGRLEEQGIVLPPAERTIIKPPTMPPALIVPPGVK